MKKIPKILTTAFLLIFIFQLIIIIFLLLTPETLNAADAKFIPQISIPDSEFTKGTPATPSVAKYIRAIYNYGIGIVGILAAVVLMFGGLLWLVAGGSAEKIGNAKSLIGAALMGLVLALTSYMLLASVNPDLVKFKDIQPIKVEEIKVIEGVGDLGNGIPCGHSKDGICGTDCHANPGTTCLISSSGVLCGGKRWRCVVHSTTAP